MRASRSRGVVRAGAPCASAPIRRPRHSSRAGAALAALLSVVAVAHVTRCLSAGWVSGPPVKLFGRHGGARPPSARNAGGPGDLPTGGSPSPSPSELKRPLEDLKVGETVHGKIAAMSRDGVYVDIGCEENALILAPRMEAYELGKNAELQGMTVEKIPARGPVRVSVPGLPKLTLFDDMAEGDTVDGMVAWRDQRRVWVDIGAEKLALMSGARQEVIKLGNKEKLKGMKVETIDLENNTMVVSYPGLSELVADRPEPKREKKESKQKENKMTESSVQSIVLDGANLRTIVLDGKNLQSETGTKIKIELRGGLSFDTTDAKGKNLVLAKGKPNVPAKGKRDPFEGIEAGQSLKGTIVIKSLDTGVWLEIGRPRKVNVVGPSPETLDLLELGEELDVVVQSVDTAAGKVDVNMPNIEEHVAGREAVERVQIKDLEVGSIVPGRFISFRKGAHFDIGAVAEARMTQEFEMPKGMFKSLTKMQGTSETIQVRLDSIDAEKGEIRVSPVKEE